MELRELAERVLFATTLEEKLQCPAVITDEKPGSAIQTPAMPGRPKELVFKVTGTSRGEFPGTQHLEKERERGRLLHFFANHELLATELMALVLLKFPDAPAAFRKGVLETLKDEQEHTRWYVERMKASGTHFGELPVSGYFWRAVSGMESPMDYVAGLSLTFEQANLDFARHFSKCFAEVGDADSARLLQKIYRDEIAHVAYGLKWFRRWKNPSESDWDAFCHQLKFPLSPARAKGLSLNVEGRRAAGLGADFIEHLNVFSQSKGRTPTVFVFNPLAEARIAGGKGFSPTKHQAQLVRDLTNLPQFLCRQDDIVIVERRPSVHFLSGLKEAGFVLPEFVEMERSAGFQTGSTPLAISKRADQEIGAPPAWAALTQRKLGGLRPWAWGPDSVELFKPLFANVTANQRPAELCFNERIAALYSKAWSADFLRKFLLSLGSSRCPEAHSENDQNALTSAATMICAEIDVGVAVDSLDAALNAVKTIRARGHHKVVLKESIGVAGSNALRLFEAEITDNQKRWITNVLETGQPIVVEPWLDRELDFSVQLEMTASGLKLCGYTGLINDAKGQFIGNWAEPKFERKLPSAVTSLLGVVPSLSNPVQQLYESLFARLEEELRQVDFLGPLGIDAFVYRDAAGARRLKPIVEINPRFTMGRVTVELMKRAAQGSYGLFCLCNRASLRSEGCDDFVALSQKLRKQFPLHFSNDPARRIAEGVVCLNEPEQAQVCLAVFQVFRNAPAFLRRTGVCARCACLQLTNLKVNG
ncbi:MAG TPA: DUF455 family protein [Verrucomicrobiae bacterium]|nr:DUF455 family protein [Verrucomicrobiae bacterium]